MRFICKDVYLRVEYKELAFTKRFEEGEILRMPIAHGEGRYYLPEEELKKIEERGQVCWKRGEL